MTPIRLNCSIQSVIGLFLLIGVNACTTVTVDELRWQQTSIDPSVDSVVILGRHHSPDYETEPELISCIGEKLEQNIHGLNIISESEFVDIMFPWFEPRTAPLNMANFERTLEQPLIRETLEEQNIRYMIWIEGATESLNQVGAMTCGIGAGGAGCFGFGSWDNESNYEASIWDFSNTQEVGRISTDAKGTSYMPAVVVPIPLLARVQNNACNGMGEQLSQFLTPTKDSG